MAATVLTCNSQVTREKHHGSNASAGAFPRGDRGGRSTRRPVGRRARTGLGARLGSVIGEGRVLTNAHNVRREQVSVVFADGRRETGEWTAADEDLDLAVLSVDTGDAPAVAWEPADAPGIGAPVVALANPGGRGLRATLGFVSSAGRSFRGPRGRRIAGAI